MRNTSSTGSAGAWLASIAFVTGTSVAAPILDQGTGLETSSGGSSGPAIVPYQSVAQSVTAGVSGRLSQIDVQIYKNTGAPGDVRLDVLPIVDGLPDASVPLLTRVIPIDEIVTRDPGADQVGWTSVDVSAADLFFSAGDVFAIELSRNEGPEGAPPWVIWSSTVSPSYADGQAFVLFTFAPGWMGFPGDVAFQTWMEVSSGRAAATSIPEPATLALLGAALAGLASRRRIRA